MTWYVAHAVMILRPQTAVNHPLYCWENLLLIQVDAEDDPWAVAEKRAKADATVEFEMSSVYGMPARWELAGIRKVVEVRHDSDVSQLRSGDELTYNTLLFEDETQIRRFIAGRECSVRYADDTPDDR